MADDQSTESQTTTDHETIREWAEERGGRPARVGGTEDEGGGGLLRIDFEDEGSDGGDDESLEQISWDEFFEEFEESNLALVYQEETSEGEESRFSKLVSRDEA